MINIAIVEDEAMYAKQLQEFLLQYQKENGVKQHFKPVFGKKSHFRA